MQRFSLETLKPKGAREPLGLNRSQSRQVTGLHNGNCHLFKLGKAYNPICRPCQGKDETAVHVLCGCEGLAKASSHLGFNFINQVTIRMPVKQNTELHSKWRTAVRANSRNVSRTRSQMVVVQGLFNVHPLNQLPAGLGHLCFIYICEWEVIIV